MQKEIPLINAHSYLKHAQKDTADDKTASI